MMILLPARRRYVLLSAAVVVAIVADWVHGTTAQDVRLSVNDVVGCYELRSIEWTPDLSTLPESEWRRFLPLTKDHELTARFPHSGFEWLYLVVSQRSSDGRFSGRPVVFTDNGSWGRQGSVVFGRVACWEN